MRNRCLSAFRYSFRAPGSLLEGPIRIAVGQTMLGKAIVGRSQRGICARLPGEETQALRDQLALQFPNIELQADQISLEHALSQVTGLIDQDTSRGIVNLDIGGTAFGPKEWQALCEIPEGQTRSYSEIARDLGVPEAARAVAGACAANVLAIAIPCHRVVRRDGSISGYRWGVDRKRALLADEAANNMEAFAA